MSNTDLPVGEDRCIVKGICKVNSLKKLEMIKEYVPFLMKLGAQSIQHGILVMEIVPVLYFGKKLVENCES